MLPYPENEAVLSVYNKSNLTISRGEHQQRR